ncbi:hypothetical protein [Herbaspirillum sp. ST 5-3]|nr:hypothetical protein [Herbaspirillum sp. ST 5-3]
MKKLAMMVAIILLAGCSSLGTSGTSGANASSSGVRSDPYDMTYRGAN